MHTATGVWRWRHNPLRRTTDLVEAWAMLAATLLIAVAAPATGWVCGALANAALQESVRVQHQQRHLTTAVVVRTAPGPASVPDPEVPSERAARVQVVADWTASDGSRHTGAVTTTQRGVRPGDRFRMWTDGRGRVVDRPMDSSTAGTHAAVAGIGAGVASVAIIEGGRRLVVWRLMQRRYARLDQDWARAGPDWGRTDAGS
ncbi:Rv1733c family protein [Streptomyces sp. A5-4]|uniref:Rv1733c family protein n=1 Tax=Streptomyces sp. A5-4 TaxID=3384771 RepID=UPI003DA9E118